jgi:OmpA-OmpF porin, OOP family
MSTRTVWAMGASLAMAAALCASDARAQFYLGGEGGWTGLEGQRSTIAGVPINQSFDGGFNVGARAGYKMGPWRFEGEYSYRQNGSNLTRFGNRFNGTVETNSLMANTIYDFDLGWLVTPHIGMGIGGVALNGNLNAPVLGYRSKTSDVVFAYQAIAGVRYMINPVLAFDLDYRYRGTADATYLSPAFTVGGVTVAAAKHTGSANTNNVVASLTYLFGAAPPPPYAPPPMPPAPPPQASRVFLVFFDWSKDTVTPEGMTIIHQAADAFRSGAAVQIQVTGYTDRSGSPGFNQRLSERRANNVAKALSQLGVPQNQMMVSGRGENDNRVPTADGVRDPQNRRVEITAS